LHSFLWKEQCQDSFCCNICLPSMPPGSYTSYLWQAYQVTSQGHICGFHLQSGPDGIPEHLLSMGLCFKVGLSKLPIIQTGQWCHMKGEPLDPLGTVIRVRLLASQATTSQSFPLPCYLWLLWSVIGQECETCSFPGLPGLHGCAGRLLFSYQDTDRSRTSKPQLLLAFTTN
jgi:hypothetical protein